MTRTILAILAVAIALRSSGTLAHETYRDDREMVAADRTLDASSSVPVGSAPLPAAPLRVSVVVPASDPRAPAIPTPAPSGGIGTALWTTSATWCAPTRTQCLRWGGHALLAALPTYTGKPYWVRVWFGERHVDVRVVSICGCGIDLSPYAFSKLADPSVGRIQVEVEGPISLPALPATDTEAVQ